jgi:hypothetical protein
MWQLDGREYILYRAKRVKYFAEAQIVDSNYPAS